jgi:Fe2+ transport system protein B
VTPTIAQPTVVLIGLESAGKTALFRGLTGEGVVDETNFRGSTVRVRSGVLPGARLVDTPGIHVQDDSVTTRLALQQVTTADTVVLVARGTHVHQEVATLLAQVGVDLRARKTALAITFEDRAAPELAGLVQHYEQTLGIPVALVNARAMTPAQRDRLLTTIAAATPLAATPTNRAPILLLPEAPVVEPQRTLLEHPLLAPWLAVLALGLLFALPVYAAYRFAEWAQPVVDGWVIGSLVALLSPLADLAPLLFAVLAGDYGLLTLGWYSFLWAFPVVVLIGISVALTEESGLKDRITAALDPWLRKIGLNGRDLIPVLSGFGCNVVAVFQSRACSACTRHACVSLIAFGSACSYQIGASLSLFNVAGTPWLFAPYLAVLFLVGTIHTRLWHGGLTQGAMSPLAERAFLQHPTWRGVWWRVRAVLRQFLREAMPIFLLICVVGALLEFLGVTPWLSDGVAPLLGLFGLPGEVAPGLIFSIIRKDGLLVLNQGDGALLQALTVGQIFVLVYLASTLTACLVTLWTIRTELGWRTALAVAGRQAATALVSTLLLLLLLRGWALLDP